MQGADHLERIGGASDGLDVDVSGMLTLGGVRADRLARTFGTPLFVTIEQVIRENARRLRGAFEARWPAGIEIFYAIKTNNSRAIRAILNDEGIGGECFGAVEYRATLDSGVPGRRILLNGSDKTEAVLSAAVAADSVINVDSLDEIPILESLGSPAAPVRANIRLRLAPKSLDRFDASFFKSGGTVSDILASAKWGFSTPRAIEVVRRILSGDRISLLGFSAHLGRFSNDPDAFAKAAEEMARVVTEIRTATGFWPTVLDLGGGWPRRREPESRGAALNPNEIGAYAEAVTASLRAGLHGPLPRLFLEPGRYLVGNAVTLLAGVTTLREDIDHRWVHVDASTNLLMRIETSRSWYHILPASRMHSPAAGPADIVGPTCVPSVFGTAREMPRLERGDMLALPDAGMYAEVLASQFNGMPLPAGVLVAPDGKVEEIRRRESYEDIFRNQCLPPRLVRGMNDPSERKST